MRAVLTPSKSYAVTSSPVCLATEPLVAHTASRGQRRHHAAHFTCSLQRNACHAAATQQDKHKYRHSRKIPEMSCGTGPCGNSAQGARGLDWGLETGDWGPETGEQDPSNSGQATANLSTRLPPTANEGARKGTPCRCHSRFPGPCPRSLRYAPGSPLPQKFPFSWIWERCLGESCGTLPASEADSTTGLRPEGPLWTLPECQTASPADIISLLPHLLVVPVSVLHPDAAHTTVAVDLCVCIVYLPPRLATHRHSRDHQQIASPSRFSAQLSGAGTLPPPSIPPPARPWRHPRRKGGRVSTAAQPVYLPPLSGEYLASSCPPLAPLCLPGNACSPSSSSTTDLNAPLSALAVLGLERAMWRL